MTRPILRLASAGFVATAVAFGPARMGFGLFLPAFRDEFALSSTRAGLIASGGFMAFLVALPLAAWLGMRAGPRLPVLLGALSACLGFLAVTAATDAVMLAAGVALAGASAGFCWTPFNDAAERVIPIEARAGALSTVSTGTTFGVTVAAALALAVTLEAMGWRTVWGVFGLIALIAAVMAAMSLPAGRIGPVPGSADALRLPPDGVPALYAAALCFGATNAIYVSFAPDHVVAAGGLAGLPAAASATVIFLGYGLCGLVGPAAGRIEGRIGLTWLVRTIFMAFTGSLVLVALAPTSWGAVVMSAGLHGAAVMTFSAVLSFWTLRLFPGRGTIGFTSALLAAAAGNVAGPSVAGLLADAADTATAFLVAAVLPVAVAGLFAQPQSWRHP